MIHFTISHAAESPLSLFLQGGVVETAISELFGWQKTIMCEASLFNAKETVQREELKSAGFIAQANFPSLRQHLEGAVEHFHSFGQFYLGKSCH